MELFPHPHSEGLVRALPRTIDGDRSVLFVATRGAGRVEGSATIWGVGEEVPRLSDVYVAEPHRRQRHGTALTEAAQAWQRSRDKPVYLHVRPDNGGARALYEGLGWTYTGAVHDGGSLWMAAPHVSLDIDSDPQTDAKETDG